MLAVPVHEDRRFQPGGELRHRRGPLRPAAEAGVQPGGSPARDGSAGRPSDEPHATGAPICSGRLHWLWPGHGRQQPVRARRRELPCVGCPVGIGGGRTLDDRAVPQRM